MPHFEFRFVKHEDRVAARCYVGEGWKFEFQHFGTVGVKYGFEFPHPECFLLACWSRSRSRRIFYVCTSNNPPLPWRCLDNVTMNQFPIYFWGAKLYNATTAMLCIYGPILLRTCRRRFCTFCGSDLGPAAAPARKGGSVNAGGSTTFGPVGIGTPDDGTLLSPDGSAGTCYDPGIALNPKIPSIKPPANPMTFWPRW